MTPSPEQIAEWREEGSDAWREDLEVMAKSKHENYVAGYIRAKTKPDQPEGEAIGRAEHLRLAIAKVCEGFTLHDGARKILETALFTHLTPITADDVTDEMVENFNSQFTNGSGMTNDDMIVAAVNAYLGVKK